MLKPIVVVAPPANVVNVPVPPPIALVLKLEIEAVVATPRVFVLIPIELEKKPVLLKPIVVVPARVAIPATPNVVVLEVA